ncbi:hypothetical protein SERLA73DRAFT_95973 [Serpula lacrymans var. lacrymans S7.3]|uniref:Small ribosomal subunit protein mS29 n=2 Tax=Serpula lacrymans var. lacrymans TaxID=341189 RepID=F8Q9T6_SERL3|nr:uncharacterized protein SERLADRAFT_358117 [Serpula lacrymans var. lacrymans S7.9]EGN95341.1 hypothetical protein SERLA73DRAFT_95973 [Serpula lacrymans var. lacrymans S7.3]EGO20873.1 hypothetical protein SERLADRAFT_358117 [Serpula lacrymans var. lacrymans S7.9]
MATLSTVCCRRTTRPFAYSKILSLHSTSSFVVQTRSYAVPKRANATKQGRQGFRGGGTQGRDGDQAPVKKEKKLMTFQPMPASQLSHPLFQSERVDELQKLNVFHPEIITCGSESEALRFPHNEDDPFRRFGLPRKMLLEFRLLSRPCTVVRGITIDVVDKLDSASRASSSDTRLVLTGAPGCGKSFLLLQAVQYCASKDWLVLYIPRGVSLVNSTTAYVYDIRTQTYLQPVFAYQTLQRFLTVNSAKLQSLSTRQATELERRPPLPAGTPLIDLINVGLRDQIVAPTVLTALMNELGQQTTHPVLLAVDDFQALFCKSTYRDPHFSRIKSYHLSMPRLFLEYASGKRSFARGAFMGALSSTDTTFKLPLELREALGLPHDQPSGPYIKRSEALTHYARGLKALAVPDMLTVSEAASLFEIWMKDKALTSAAHDESFLAKYSEASGNARNFVWKGLLSTLAM